MANKNVTAAPQTEQQVSKTEAFFEKNKKAIIIAVVAVIAIVVGAILFNNYYLFFNESNLIQSMNYYTSILHSTF